MEQMWLEVLQEVNEGLITNEQASCLGDVVRKALENFKVFIKEPRTKLIYDGV